MGRIFLSYSSEDRRCAEALARTLEEAGHEVWWDRRIDSGDEFAAEIEAELDRADVIAVAWSQHSARSPWVRDEAQIGRDTGRLLPLSIDGSQPPIGFRQFQALDLTGWKGRSKDSRTAALLRAVDRRLKRRPTSGYARAPVKRPRRRFEFAKENRLRAAVLALLVISGIGGGALWFRQEQSRADPASLAVLPFRNMAAGGPYFAEGVAEEISDQLSREPQFKVAGRTSSDLFKDAADVRDVGRRLHVAYVLEGSVRSAGQQVRVDVALVDARGGMRLWSQDFRGSLDDIFAIQDSIGEQVADHVRKQLIRGAALSTMRTSGDVYSMYVTARALMREREPSKIDAAVDLLRRAVKADPNYAPAWARLALALSLQRTYDESGGPFAPEKERIADARRAVVLAPALPDAHAILGLLLNHNEEMDSTETRQGRKELERAVSLNPNDAESWYWLYYARLAALDFDGALDALRRSARIDPFFNLAGEHLAYLAWDMGYRADATQFLSDRIANHPDPFMRAIARAQLAELRNELPAAYEYARQAREVALPDVRSNAEGHMGSILLDLGLFDQAERIVPADIVSMWRGKLTFAKAARQAFPHPLDFWRTMDPNDGAHRLPRLLVKIGRSRELVTFYDQAFSSPQNMAERYSNLAFVDLAPMLAIGLQQAGRVKEGSTILLIGNVMCRRGTQGGDAPRSFRVSCSRLWSVLGYKELAIATLRKAIEQGWRPADADYAPISDEPAYGVIRNDPRIQRMSKILASDAARDRGALLAAGL